MERSEISLAESTERFSSFCEEIEKALKGSNVGDLHALRRKLKDFLKYADMGGENFSDLRKEIREKIKQVKNKISDLESRFAEVSIDLRQNLAALIEKLNSGDKKSLEFLSEMKDEFAQLKMLISHRGRCYDTQLKDDIDGKIKEIEELISHLNKN